MVQSKFMTYYVDVDVDIAILVPEPFLSVSLECEILITYALKHYSCYSVLISASTKVSQMIVPAKRRQADNLSL